MLAVLQSPTIESQSAWSSGRAELRIEVVVLPASSDDSL